MNSIIEGVIDINEMSEYTIIDFIDICNYINVYENNNVNIKVNNYDLNYENNNNQTVEIISLNVNIYKKNIKKISSNNTNIYIINFITNISFKIIKNNKIEDIEIKNMYSKSFIYKDIEKSNLDLYPINFEFKEIDNKINFAINFIIVDKSKDLELNYKSSTDSFIIEDINNKHYSYIDTNQEFM
ncbi:MAG: hypothetical protein ACRC3Y_08855 [Romboutsia sp.]|uniref:hypothetical protein n=1 Tax=Romboutsia sp. TaxID=1965302 RepID=UPI003F2B7364